jgi:hypothetical protein
MLKIICMIVLAMLAGGALAQTSSAPPPVSLDVAQQRARFAREQLLDAERKAQAAEQKDKAARKRFDEAKSQADQSSKELQEAQAQFARARERHDQAYQELKRAHGALQESNKQQ